MKQITETADHIRYTIKMDRELHRRMKLAAVAERKTIQSWIEEAIREKLKNDKEDSMKLTDAQSQTLLDINCGDRPLRASNYNSRTIGALEERGLITVRDNDGDLRVTTNGLDYLAINHPAKENATRHTDRKQMEQVIEMLEKEAIVSYPDAFGFLADNGIEDPDSIMEYLRRLENGSIEIST